MRWQFQIQRLMLQATTCAVVLAAASSLFADAPVSLEVATEPDFPQTEVRGWAEMLGEVGFSNVRIRGGNSADRPLLDTGGTPDAPTYRVVGLLSSDGQLVLPSGRFRLSDRGRIEAWLAKLREGGEEGLTTKTEAFGLLPRQLVAVHEALAVPVDFSTKGQPPRDVAKRIADRLSLKFITDAAGQRALASSEPVLDELQGLSSGTALAALLRPLGLVLVPEKSGGDVRLRIVDGQRAKEHWPVGWPPKNSTGQTAPELFKFLNVEISSVSVAEAVTAIAGRVKLPVLYDHNSLAQAGFDLEMKVDVARTNTFYAKALDRILVAHGMRWEVRVDEAGKPLLWITTRKQ